MRFKALVLSAVLLAFVAWMAGCGNQPSEVEKVQAPQKSMNVQTTQPEQKTGPAEWLTNYSEAVNQAKQQNKVILMDFTGSDWCGWCKKLDKEVFKTQDFNTFAREKLVLLKVDFPQSIQLSAEQEEQNFKLARKYNIEGYPTLILLNPQEKAIGKMGYMRGGPEVFLKELQKQIS